MKLLVDKGADVYTQGGDFSSALQAASFRGHEAVVKLLLDKVADVNEQKMDYGNALQAALFGGHTAVAKLLRAEWRLQQRTPSPLRAPKRSPRPLAIRVPPPSRGSHARPNLSFTASACSSRAASAHSPTATANSFAAPVHSPSHSPSH